jgi:aminoglycoside 6'-N-acetyltransferase I
MVELLTTAFDHATEWSTVEAAERTLSELLDHGFCFVALEKNRVAGWVGALPLYDGNVWELHPLVVRREHRRRGIGSALVNALESEARAQGAVTVTLGADDVAAQTTLANVDLYGDLPSKLAQFENPGGHVAGFYSKLGYVITGVVPDANGAGKPDILMSKALGPR